MSSRPFTHLHCHSHYSLLDGASKIPALVQRVKAMGMDAIAVTDHGNMHAAVEFLRESKAAGIKPIVGMEAYVAPGHRGSKVAGGHSGKEHYFHLTLLARNAEGFRNLCRLSSRAFLEGKHHKPRIDNEILEQHKEGLIVLSGCVGSEFSDHILHDRFDLAEKLAVQYQRWFGEEHFYVEIQSNNVQIQRDHAERAIDFARRIGMPLVGTSDAHYLMQGDAEVHDLLLCINTGARVDDPKRMRFESNEFHVRSPAEMYAAMPDQAEALGHSVKIAGLVEENYKSLNLGQRQFPSFKPPGQQTPEEYLRELCEKGMADRYQGDPPQAARDRMEHELGIINRMGFASYFLIVWDFVRYAREQGIPNSARGSACGALVSYLLYLSHVDPLVYDLLFERFLDPNRSEAPDIDIDLCKERRVEVIAYVREKYGAENVAMIGTFGTMAAKASLKDVGRALNVPLARVDQITKLVPTRPNITLAQALDEEPQLNRLVAEDPEFGRMMDYALRLEGTARNVGTHAAGVVIADRPLMHMVPLQVDKKGIVSTQWEMGDVEKAGLLKMDFLGLRNLTSLEAAVKLINGRHPDAPIDIMNLPLDDEPTYALLQRGEAKGVFQLDGAGIRDLLVKMKPDRFADLIAILALYRPGPLNGGMVDEYVDVKHKRKSPQYEHQVMKDVLEETYGVMVYQEQVMRILNRLGGIELSKAYACIKAISKKKMETIAEGREQFVKGAVEKGVDKAKAVKIFELIEFFGGYGFNKSHTCAYALVAYQTAWLKTHYPTEFMAALLSSEMDGAERDKFFVDHVEDCRRMGIELLPPNINEGQLGFSVPEDGKIHFGLGAVKGVGERAIQAILEARAAGGPFTGLDNLVERVPAGLVSQSNIETLIYAGAFDCLGARRSQLLAILPRAVQGGQAIRKVRSDTQQKHMFDQFDSSVAEEAAGPAAATMVLPDIEELADAVKLAEEKKALGLYMTSHPLARHSAILQALATHQVCDLGEIAEKSKGSGEKFDFANRGPKVEVVLGGMIVGLQVKNVSKSRSGLTRMGKMTFEDLTGSIPAMLWPEEFARFESQVKEDQIVFVRGSLDCRRDPAELIISRVIPLERAASELSRGVIVRLHKGSTQPDDLERLLRTVRNYPGNLDLYLEILGLANVRRAIYKAGSSLKVRYDDAMLTDLKRTAGVGNVLQFGPRGAFGGDEAPANPVPVAAAASRGFAQDFDEGLGEDDD
ncbi:DNA polymerase III subunit alpha [Tundrisphaera sp. TA3]|uniref:DNA polymerase III subunit alpha n=1 Tax=Tundrisphaera sp. TA3 TaxID=3435775 RepID=UPI003EBD357D